MTTPVLSPEPEAPPPSRQPDRTCVELMEELVNEVAEESRAKTTRYQQGQQWKTFVRSGAKPGGLQSLPADPETVAVFIFTQGFGGKKSQHPQRLCLQHRRRAQVGGKGQPLHRPGGHGHQVVRQPRQGRRASGRNAPNPSPPRIWRRSGKPPASRERPTAGWSVSPMPVAAAWWTSPSSR